MIVRGARPLVLSSARGANATHTFVSSLAAKPGGTWVMVVGHVVPDAFDGGTIALIEEGGLITIEAHTIIGFAKSLVCTCPVKFPAGRQLASAYFAT